MERIRLIWDFRNIEAEKIALHHVKHLNEYLSDKKVSNSSAHHQQISEHHWIAFIDTDRENMILLRDALKPQRGEKLK